MEIIRTVRPLDRPPVVPSTQLLGGRSVIHIDHNGERYVLRLTRNDRLILTK
jgi:hemin uptake protein HemP